MKPKNFDITALFNRMSLDQLQEMRKNMLDQLAALDKYIAEKYPNTSDPEVSQ